MIKKYKLEWVSSLDSQNQDKLDTLSEKMANYYRTNSNYYSDISSSEGNWTNEEQILHKDILDKARKATKILEIGCGESPILKAFPDLSKKYHGIDFSEDIINSNRKKFPHATFSTIKNPSKYDFANEEFDLIFSVFVIEHTVFPKKFLDECIRLIKRKGKIIVLAPNYLENNFMASQQVSDGLLSGRELLKKGDFSGAFTATLYNKYYIPKKCKELGRNLPGFYININPICFAKPEFRPDVDATYVVSQIEIDMYMKSKGFQIENMEAKIDTYKKNNLLVYQIYKKK